MALGRDDVLDAVQRFNRTGSLPGRSSASSIPVADGQIVPTLSVGSIQSADLRYDYDASAVSLVGASVSIPAEIPFPQVDAGEGVVASPDAEAVGASTTPLSLTSTPRGGADGVIRGPGPRGGEWTAAVRGRQAHQSWDYGPGFRSEFRLPSGRRVDGINFRTREVVELKPNNPRAIREGQRQLYRYPEELNLEYPGTPGPAEWRRTIHEHPKCPTSDVR